MFFVTLFVIGTAFFVGKDVGHKEINTIEKAQASIERQTQESADRKAFEEKTKYLISEGG